MEYPYSSYNLVDLLDNKEEPLYHKSPFLYHNDIRYTCENKKITCTFDEMHTLFVKGLLDNQDWDILKALYKYRFLNRHVLEIYLNVHKKNGIKKRLNKLVSQGILLRFYLSWNNNDELNKQSSPFFYSLSKGAYSFFKKRNPLGTIIDNTNHAYELPNEINILNRLVFNQFHVNFMKQYGKNIIKQRYFERITMHGYEFFIEGYFRMKSNSSSIFNTFDIVVISLRRSPEWQKEFTNKLSLIYSYAKKNTLKIKEPIILVICEDDIHAKEAFLHKEYNLGTRHIYTLYTSDITVMTEDILKYLYFFELINNYPDTQLHMDDGKQMLTNIDNEIDTVLYNPDEIFTPSYINESKVHISIRSILL